MTDNHAMTLEQVRGELDYHLGEDKVTSNTVLRRWADAIDAHLAHAKPTQDRMAQALRDQFWTDIVITEKCWIFKRYRLDFRLINGVPCDCMDLPLFGSNFDARLVANAISEAYRAGRENTNAQ